MILAYTITQPWGYSTISFSAMATPVHGEIRAGQRNEMLQHNHDDENEWAEGKKNPAGEEYKNNLHEERLMKIHEGFPLVCIQAQIVFTSLGCEADYSSSVSHQPQRFQFPPSCNENDILITSALFCYCCSIKSSSLATHKHSYFPPSPFTEVAHWVASWENNEQWRCSHRFVSKPIHPSKELNQAASLYTCNKIW